MEESAVFHFAEPLWLLALALPLVLWLMPRMRHARDDSSRLAAFADPHLLPHLLIGGLHGQGGGRRRLVWWSLIWLLGVLALAGPRWDYTDVQLRQPGSNLVVLLDLSRSMDVADVRPTRLTRARQEVEDLLAAESGVKIGLVAFASVAHVVAPVTEDTATLRHLLPSLSTDLLRFSGSRLGEGLEQSLSMLAGRAKGESRAVLVISDGDFAEKDLDPQLERLRDAGVKIHVLGVGTPQGGAVPMGHRSWNRTPASRVVSRLEEERLKELAQTGGGIYRRADFREIDTDDIVQRLVSDANPAESSETERRIWHERFTWLVLFMLAGLLPWFRRGTSGSTAHHGV
ncbi:MAG: VWA domain-containing protein [Pseudomonadota bacterium]